ncbi:uncharacterized protein J4E78_009629 [Alternaria triticimaculans]|uniref:uncharacterized protein n=1 Tax=Alternaria triticimaculans TaxID=297637 RepID=UPI0020C21FB8|nr:uncharacterized protein J4E78_009629 [Alternaria triticimaculans]KAI4644810.1 hypothetical protein J4E78_009629 [Alternaria triticimaculans]
MEGGFSRALLLRKEDGSEIVAKIPFPIAGPPKYTTASEVAVLKYLNKYTQVLVPKVSAWDADPSNPVGAEYIIMEKALGVQLYNVWDDLNDLDRLRLLRQLAIFESEMTKIRLPASGSLYLSKSMAENDAHVSLDQEMDPSGEFCIGPSCERGWHVPDESASLSPHFNRGPWPDLSSFGTALVDRELAILRNRSFNATSGSPRGTLDEQIDALNMTREVMSRLHERTLVSKVSNPVLWHTDLHMGNIYVSGQNPPQISSIIDWQSIVVSPLFLQARFPEFLTVDEDYQLGTMELPPPPPDLDKMDAGDKRLSEFKYEQAKATKPYELNCAAQNTMAWKALKLPAFLRELFTRCAEVSEEGEIPLRACLIEVAAVWNRIGFKDECPLNFSEEDLQKHEQQFEEYSNYHNVHELAREIISTDFEGWINPRLDFSAKQQQNQGLLKEFVRRSSEFGMTPEKMRSIWPYLDRS